VDTEISNINVNNIVGDLTLEDSTETYATTLSVNEDGLNVDGNVVIDGNLTVQGTETILNTETLTVEDKNVVLGNLETPTDTTADGGGITLKGTTDKTILYSDLNNRWDFNVPIAVNDSVVSTATDLALKANIASPTFTGQVAFTPSTLGTTGSIAIDFAGDTYRTQAALTGNITYTGSNYANGRSVTIRVINGSTQRTLTFPSQWRFVGPKPANIAASKVAILTLASFGTAEADVIAGWAVEA
jgi:hypothetical protein